MSVPALCRRIDVLDCISVPMEKIRLAFEPLSPGIRASITRTYRFREIYAFPHSTFDDVSVNSKIWSLALCQSSLSRHEFLAIKA